MESIDRQSRGFGEDVAHQIVTKNPLGESVQKTDDFGNIIETKDAAGRTSTYKYDELDRQIYAQDYRGGIVRNKYNGFNNLTEKTTASFDSGGGGFNTFYYTYDKLDRVLETKDKVGLISRFEYDKVGNKIDEYLMVNDGAERHNKYAYDQLNRQISMTMAVGDAELVKAETC